MAKGMGQLKGRGLGKPVAMRKKDLWGVGATRFKRRIMNMAEYRQTKSMCLLRAHNKCENCGAGLGELSPNGNVIEQLDLHHIQPLDTLLKQNNITNIQQARLCLDLWDLNNMQILCHDCHVVADGGSYGRGKNK